MMDVEKRRDFCGYFVKRTRRPGNPYTASREREEEQSENMSALNLTIPEKDRVQSLMEQAVRSFLSENEQYRAIVFDILRRYPTDFGFPVKKAFDERYCIQRLAQMVNVSKVEAQILQYITKEYSFMAQDYGDEFPDEVTLDVYVRLAREQLFDHEGILKTLVMSAVITDLMDRFYLPALLHSLMKEAAEAPVS